MYTSDRLDDYLDQQDKDYEENQGRHSHISMWRKFTNALMEEVALDDGEGNVTKGADLIEANNKLFDRILTERYEDSEPRFCACGNELTLHDRETGQVVCRDCR